MPKSSREFENEMKYLIWSYNNVFIGRIRWTIGFTFRINIFFLIIPIS